MISDQLQPLLSTLSTQEQYLFGLCCTQRILPLYMYFDDTWQVNNYPYLAENVNSLYDKCATFNDAIPISGVDTILAAVDDMTPYSDDYDGGLEVLFAQDVAASITYCFSFIKDFDIKNIIYISACLVEIVDAIASDQSDQDVDTDALVELEISKQKQYIVDISRTEINSTVVSEFRKRAERDLLSFNR